MRHVFTNNHFAKTFNETQVFQHFSKKTPRDDKARTTLKPFQTLQFPADKPGELVPDTLERQITEQFLHGPLI